MDYSERELWPDYIEAFEDVFHKTSTSHAPWYIIPANRINATSKKLLEFYRAPTLPGVTNNYEQALGRPQNRDQFILRMDYVRVVPFQLGRPV